MFFIFYYYYFIYIYIFIFYSAGSCILKQSEKADNGIKCKMLTSCSIVSLASVSWYFPDEENLTQMAFIL